MLRLMFEEPIQEEVDQVIINTCVTSDLRGPITYREATSGREKHH